LFVVYNFAVSLANFLLPAISLFDEKIKKGVKGRRDTFKFLKENVQKNDLVFWFHCASLGEYEQGLPVFKKIKQSYPKAKIVLSFFSPSGYEIRRKNPITPIVVYLPLDTQKNVESFLKITNPKMVVFVKYELWPNYLGALKTHAAKVFLISALFRPDQYFFKSFTKRWREPILCFDYIFTQNIESLNLLKSVGYTKASVSNDSRFDRVLNQLEQNNNLPIIDAFIDSKTCIVAGSTWAEDEALLTPYINSTTTDLKFIIAPHNIDKQRVQKLLKKLGNKACLHSDHDIDTLREKQVLIIDSIGLLSKLYCYADIAYVGGGMGHTGLHNTLEAAVFSVPIIIGQNYSQFPEARAMLELGGLFSVKDSKAFQNALDTLLDDEKVRTESGKKNREYIDQNKGATEIIFRKLKEYL
jgi:3-deoxy-D-manno-octulosonic-acid transferase